MFFILIDSCELNNNLRICRLHWATQLWVYDIAIYRPIKKTEMHNLLFEYWTVYLTSYSCSLISYACKASIAHELLFSFAIDIDVCPSTLV